MIQGRSRIGFLIETAKTLTVSDDVFSEQLHQFLVSRAFYGRRGDFHPQRRTLFTRNFAARRTRNNSNRESEAAAVFGTLNHSAGIVNRKFEIVNRSFAALFKD